MIEHLQDPIILAQLLKENGKMIVEVPNANDALLTIFKNKSYQDFIYWSAHLYYFTPNTLRKLGEKAGLKVDFVKGIQRYPFSNNLYWLAFGKPAGEKEWKNFIDDALFQKNWESTLASLGATDTLIACFRAK
ncbi:class I SAM-dependent methyltransferase [Helicobacter sp. MIT 05-5294]|uniref:class I SAM-dependent methyltransferase n=1 Tax=Helicobacter sp. MIT 05-5294 TaxID=1548150 RepID=UPI000A90C466|nr:class I SAM-dependent methyltransferase [Helicobacter sp. MIT 05-5294]